MNLLQTIMGQLGPDTIGKLSGLLGESESSTKTALGAAIPTLMGQVADKANSEKGASALFDMVKDNDESQDFSSMLDNKDALLNNGSSALNSLMGSRSGALTSILSKFTGMGGNSMTSLLGMITPLIMGSLGKAKSSMGLNASGLSSLLSQQSDSFKSAMPSGLADQMGSFGLGAAVEGVKGAAGNVVSGAGNLAGKAAGGVKDGAGAVGGAVGGLGRGAANAAGSVGTGAANVAGGAAEAGGGMLKKLGPIIGFLLMALLALFAWKQCGSDVKDAAGNAADATKNVAEKAADATKNAADKTLNATKNAADKTLDATKNAAGAVADGVKDGANAVGNAAEKAVDATKDAAGAVGNAAKNTVKKGAEALGLAANSVEADFVTLLSSGKAKVGDKIALKNVKFTTGSANLDRSSYVQLNNLTKIMEAYPSLKVKLEGHTDNTGDAAKNVTLSKARANAAMNYLVSKGIAKNRLQADGVGGSKPVVKNTTTDGRKQNRRVEASILSL